MANKEDEIIEMLILEGALEIGALDAETGEFLYTITPKMKDVMPELYEEHIRFVNKDILNLWEKGFVDINFLEEDPVVKVSKKAFNKEAVSQLSKQEFWALTEVKRLLLK